MTTTKTKLHAYCNRCGWSGELSETNTVHSPPEIEFPGVHYECPKCDHPIRMNWQEIERIW